MTAVARAKEALKTARAKAANPPSTPSGKTSDEFGSSSSGLKKLGPSTPSQPSATLGSSVLGSSGLGGDDELSGKRVETDEEAPVGTAAAVSCSGSGSAKPTDSKTSEPQTLPKTSAKALGKRKMNDLQVNVPTTCPPVASNRHACAPLGSQDHQDQPFNPPPPTNTGGTISLTHVRRHTTYSRPSPQDHTGRKLNKNHVYDLDADTDVEMGSESETV